MGSVWKRDIFGQKGKKVDKNRKKCPKTEILGLKRKIWEKTALNGKWGLYAVGLGYKFVNTPK